MCIFLHAGCSDLMENMKCSFAVVVQSKAKHALDFWYWSSDKQTVLKTEWRCGQMFRLQSTSMKSVNLFFAESDGNNKKVITTFLEHMIHRLLLALHTHTPTHTHTHTAWHLLWLRDLFPISTSWLVITTITWTPGVNMGACVSVRVSVYVCVCFCCMKKPDSSVWAWAISCMQDCKMRKLKCKVLDQS